MLYVSPVTSSLSSRHNNISWKVYIMKLLVVMSNPVVSTSSPLHSTLFPDTLILPYSQKPNFHTHTKKRTKLYYCIFQCFNVIVKIWQGTGGILHSFTASMNVVIAIYRLSIWPANCIYMFSLVSGWTVTAFINRLFFIIKLIAYLHSTLNNME